MTSIWSLLIDKRNVSTDLSNLCARKYLLFSKRISLLKRFFGLSKLFTRKIPPVFGLIVHCRIWYWDHSEITVGAGLFQSPRQVKMLLGFLSSILTLEFSGMNIVRLKSSFFPVLRFTKTGTFCFWKRQTANKRFLEMTKKSASVVCHSPKQPGNKINVWNFRSVS